jgi:hypothetical protein
MPATRPWAVSQALPTPADQRKQLAAIYPREGVFPSPTSVAVAGIAYPNGGWDVGARVFGAALKRGGLPYTQGYGVALISNDTAATAWTIPGAPSSGSRIDRLWIRATDPTQGEAATAAATLGEAADRAVPVFGVTSGVTLSALPAGAFEVARVTTPSTASSIAQSTFSHPYAFASVIGGVNYYRTAADRDADTTSRIDGALAYVISTGQMHIYSASAPVPGWYHSGGRPDIDTLAYTGIYSAGAQAPRVLTQAGRVNLEGTVTSSSAQFNAGITYGIGSIPSALAPATTQTFSASSNGTAVAAVTVDTSGNISMMLNTTFTGALLLSLSGISWKYKGL